MSDYRNAPWMIAPQLRRMADTASDTDTARILSAAAAHMATLSRIHTAMGTSSTPAETLDTIYGLLWDAGIAPDCPDE